MHFQEILKVFRLKAAIGCERHYMCWINFSLQPLGKHIRVTIFHVNTVPKREGVSHKCVLDICKLEIKVLPVAVRIGP
jgi:hypothetical protein